MGLRFHQISAEFYDDIGCYEWILATTLHDDRCRCCIMLYNLLRPWDTLPETLKGI